MLRRRPDWTLFVALLIAQLVVLASTPVLTGHDLPQHLAYVRLLSDWDAGHLAPVFEPPFGDDPYFVTYRILETLSKVMPLGRALTILYGAYAIAMSLAFAALARAAGEHRRGEPCMSIVFGPLIVWSPVTAMGFIPFMVGTPAVLLGCAAALRFARQGQRAHLAVVALVAMTLASLHVALLGMWMMALGCLWLARPSKRAMLTLGAAIAGSAVVLAWFVRHREPTTPFDWDRLAFNVKTFGLVDGVSGTFVMQWSVPGEKAKLALATVLGPFPWKVKLATAVGIAAFAIAVLLEKRRLMSPSRSRRTLLLGAVLFVLASIALPTAIQKPDDMCMIDLRLYALAFALGLAAFPTHWLSSVRSRVALAALGAMFVSAWGWSIIGAGEEARAAVALAQKLGPDDRVLALSFHDRSAYLDEDNAVMHYLPVHHTASSGGSTTLFWGKFSRHLPIGWAPQQEPPHPQCWYPEEFNDAQLSAATHVLVSLPHDDDELEKKVGAQRLLSLVGTRLSRVACERDFCLFEVR